MSIASFVASAELIETDWKVSGDKTATLDTVSGLEWLDLTVTIGMTINQAAQEISQGGSLEGWRFPTLEEVYALIDNNVLDATEGTDFGSDGYSGTLSTTYTSDIKNKLGSYYGSYQLSETTSTFAGVYTNFWYIYKDRAFFSLDVNPSYYGTASGVYLVSDGGLTHSSIQDPTLGGYRATSSVPLSSSISFLFLGLGLMLTRKKK